MAGYGVLNAEGVRGTRRVRRRRPHPGGHLPAGQGRRRPAVAAVSRRHRAQRHLPGQPGGPQRRRDPRPRHPLRRPVHQFLAARLHLCDPAHPADPGRRRPGRAGPQLPGHAGRGGQPAGRARPVARGAGGHAGHRPVAGRHRGLGPKSGNGTPPRTAPRRPPRCGRSGCSPTCGRSLPDDGILLSDVGVHHNWIVQEWRPGGPGTLLQSWGFASMCFGMAGVLGARLAAPDTPAVAVVGDGGFLMLPGVVATAVEYGIPGDLAGLEQRGLHLHPRPAARLLRRRARAGHHVQLRRDAARRTRPTTRRWPGPWARRACGWRPPGDLGPALKTALDSGLPDRHRRAGGGGGPAVRGHLGPAPAASPGAQLRLARPG